MGSADARMLARLAGLPEFQALRRAFDEQRELQIGALAQRNFSVPSNHDSIEWERLKAYHRGVDDVFRLVDQALKQNTDTDSRR